MDEITAEFEVAGLAEPVVLRTRPRVTVAGKTDLGRVRENNEDKFEYFLPEQASSLANRGLVFVVCDGMGGHEAGQIASELACKTFLDVYLSHPSPEPKVASQAAISAANRFVLDVARAIPSRKGMGTTLTALALIQDRFLIGHVGDSRAYRLRAGALEQLTDDHTFVEESVRQGTTTREEAENSPYRHMLTRAIGAEDGMVPDFYEGELEVEDCFLLCSDGVTNHVSDDQLHRFLSEFGPSEAAWKIVNAALAGGGSDNATVLVVRIDSLDPVDDN